MPLHSCVARVQKTSSSEPDESAVLRDTATQNLLAPQSFPLKK